MAQQVDDTIRKPASGGGRGGQAATHAHLAGRKYVTSQAILASVTLPALVKLYEPYLLLSR